MRIEQGVRKHDIVHDEVNEQAVEYPGNDSLAREDRQPASGENEDRCPDGRDEVVESEAQKRGWDAFSECDTTDEVAGDVL